MARDSKGKYKKFTAYDILFFCFLFILCVAGTVGFMWFAVGIESGNVIMKNSLKALVDNAPGIVIVLLVFNMLLALFYSKKS